MPLRRPSDKLLNSLCAHIGPGDGEDPRLAREPRNVGKRKARQLCAQVSEALQYALAESPEDDVLLALHVVSVEPAPDTSRMLVTLAFALNAGETLDPAAILERLDAASGRLRWAVANAVTRRRAPTLMFRLEIG